MKKIISLALTLILVLGLCACSEKPAAKQPEAKTFRVGVSRINITPTGSVNLDGYDDRMSEGILNPVMATCVAITDVEDNTILLYTVDMCNTEKATINSLRQRLTESTGVPGDNITISGTHTHSSPAEPYSSDYINKLVLAGEEAMADRAPATIQAGSYVVPGMNFVRHYIKNDGTYKGDNYGDNSSGYKSHASDADETMRLIRFQREGDKKDVLMVNWQVHPKLASTADSEDGKATRNLLSSDFIGFARDYVEAREDVLMAYYTGAAGNLNPLSKIAEEQAKVSKNAQKYGEQFGDHVIAALKELQPLETGKVASTKAPLGERGFYLHAYTVGGSLGFATVPAEIFDTTGNQIREGSPWDMTFVLTIANGRDTYIPTEDVWDYPVGNGDTPYEVRICRYPRGTAESLAQDLVGMLNDIAE